MIVREGVLRYPSRNGLAEKHGKKALRESFRAFSHSRLVYGSEFGRGFGLGGF